MADSVDVGIGCLVGLVLGVVGMMGLQSCSGPTVNEVKVFKEENKPAVARIYIRGTTDKILVEDLAEKDWNKYVPLHGYLDSIEDRADRELEEARIRKQVRWYEE